MGILKYLKSLFINKANDNQMSKSDENSNYNEYDIIQELNVVNLHQNKINLNGSKKESNEELKALRRKKYAQSNFNLENRLECEVLNYLLANECNCFNVYWNLYIPYSSKRYMQIDHLVVTGDSVYSVECKDFQNCISIEVFAEHWECYYRNEHYKSTNGVAQNNKHIGVLKQYLKDYNMNLKSIVILVVDDNFEGYIPDAEVILVRNKEFDLIFKLLDRKLKFNCDENLDFEFVELNKKIYECMNQSYEIIKSHKDYINQRYK
ncbi:MAG: nuclease-related domain-containing protein [Sarcina sp.]